MRATKVNAGLAESNGKLLLGIWRDSLHVTCGLTACTPGSAQGTTLGNEYGKTLPLPFFKGITIPIWNIRSWLSKAVIIVVFIHPACKSTKHFLKSLFLSDIMGWLGSQVVSVLDWGAEEPGFKSQPRRCRVTVLGKLFTSIVPLVTKQISSVEYSYLYLQ